MIETIEVNSCVRVYNRIWTPTLATVRNRSLQRPYAVAVMKRDDIVLAHYLFAEEA